MSRLHRGRRLLKARLVEQARTLGLTGEGAEANEAVPEPPVKLDAYRTKRGGS
jgi:hypothetical protein